ncbi:patatin-like phospholipase family protein [Granulicella sp. 5B5]|uniref:patatin-like phospholipase family protein n=1 Tax=Granulicella sp. 5B5 TaxID=1617967 RepID=UPI0023DDF03D|nr:patatin-like phospholipase family protein [Granulicella sp. 5B5]
MDPLVAIDTRRRVWPMRAVCCGLAFALFAATAAAQVPDATPAVPASAAASGTKDAPSKPKKGQAKVDQKNNTNSQPANAGEEAASTQKLKLGPLDPSVPPQGLPTDRPAIGVALGGGAALALTEVGVLRWFEEHHIPVDVLAGTSMGSIVGALYSTGHTPEEMEHVLNEQSVTSVFRIQQAYKAESFRRREDSRELPNAVTIGLKHGISFRNAILTDTGLNELLDKEFLRYNDQMDFNDLPIPFRCTATDLNDADSVTFSRGSLPDAVRASASLPGVFRPFSLDGHEYVDGGILKNLPTQDVKDMGAQVVIAVSLPLQPVGKGDLDSILGVLQRAFAVAIEDNERQERKLANIVIVPNVDGFGANDYLKTTQLAQRGYEAAEVHKAELLKYAVNEAEWKRYIDQRAARERGPVKDVLRIAVNAPDPAVKHVVEKMFAPLVDKPVNTDEVEKLLAEVRSDGRYEADYTVGYDSAVPSDSQRPILLVTVSDKKTGPPFLDVGINFAAQSGGVTRATLDTILLYQDLGGYGSELRTNIDAGFLTRLKSEYYRKLGDTGYFVAPRMDLSRQPYYIYSGSTFSGNTRLSERQLEFGGGGVDAGWGNGREQEVRVGWQDHYISWETTTGSDGLPDYANNSQYVRAQYTFDSQDRALVPQYGIRSTTTFGYLYDTPGSPNAPEFTTQISFAQTLGKKNIFLADLEGGTYFNRNVAQPFRFTLGGPLRLSASAIDQYRGTDYFLATPGYLRRIRALPAPINGGLYVGGAYEIGQMRAPFTENLLRQDVYFGVVAETPLGVISVAPAIGNGGERKLIFTLGRLF